MRFLNLRKTAKLIQHYLMLFIFSIFPPKKFYSDCIIMIPMNSGKGLCLEELVQNDSYRFILS